MSLISADANAWLLFFLSGSLTSKIGDLIAESEEESSVSSNTKVGDKIAVNGKVMLAKSLSGALFRCTNTDMPKMALLEPFQMR